MTTTSPTPAAARRPADRLSTDLASWCVVMVEMPFCDHVIEWSAQVVLVDPDLHGDLDWILAHAFAHIDLEHYGPDPFGPFRPEECADADGLARLALDLVPAWVFEQRAEDAVPASDSAARTSD